MRHDPGEAKRALDAAHDHLREARELRPEVREVSSSLRALRHSNHFTETIAAIMRGQR